MFLVINREKYFYYALLSKSLRMLCPGLNVGLHVCKNNEQIYIKKKKKITQKQ